MFDFIYTREAFPYQLWESPPRAELNLHYYVLRVFADWMASEMEIDLFLRPYSQGNVSIHIHEYSSSWLEFTLNWLNIWLDCTPVIWNSTLGASFTWQHQTWCRLLPENNVSKTHTWKDCVAWLSWVNSQKKTTNLTKPSSVRHRKLCECFKNAAPEAKYYLATWNLVVHVYYDQSQQKSLMSPKYKKIF